MRIAGDPATMVEVIATAMASNGHAVARDETGKVVFVEGALPGEKVVAEVTSQRAKYCSARAVEIVEASPDRVEPPCNELARGCGGCQWQHIALDAQRRLKSGIVADALRRIGHLDEAVRPTVELAPWAFRTTVRAGIKDGRAALRMQHSDQLVDIPGCLITHPALSELLHGRRYPGATEVLLRCGARSGKRMAAVTPARIKADLPSDVARTAFDEVAAGRSWRISARSFFQSRPDGVDALAALVLDAAGDLGAPSLAVDLYSGVGVFAGLLAEAGWSVTAVEGSASSVGDARTNLAGLDVTVVRGDVATWAAAPARLVVADPSRDGLGREGVRTIAATGARRVVLISCDAASLGRDAGLLARSGYRITSVTPVDMFPHSFHVEAVTVFDLA